MISIAWCNVNLRSPPLRLPRPNLLLIRGRARVGLHTSMVGNFVEATASGDENHISAIGMSWPSLEPSLPAPSYSSLPVSFRSDVRVASGVTL